MFAFAILIGIYSYFIFALGLLGILYKPYIFLLTIIYILTQIYFYRSKIRIYLLKSFEKLKIIQRLNVNLFRNNKVPIVILSLLGLQIIVNFIGTLGPELSFDALWYHLTLPKIYLNKHFVDYIPGGLLYYSTIPKLTEMLYVATLTFGDEIFAKITHFFFGIFSLIALFYLSRKFLSKILSLLVLLFFYSNLVVGWLSITAYVDLTRTFFETMALWGFINWWEKGEKKWLVESGIMLGLAISVKLLSLGSLLIFALLIVFYFLNKISNFKNLITCLMVYLFISLLIPFPWFLFSFVHTGNAIYPFFSNLYSVKINFSLINPLNLSDPISPLYVILLPIGFLFFKKQKLKLKVISLYSILAILVWLLTPNTGGGRFILPYLPAFSILSLAAIKIVSHRIKITFLIFIIFLSLFSISYRFVANLRYIPFILGKETKAHFLSNHLNFSFGDFYDTDGFFAKTIKSRDKVLLYGFHNLYYVNFPFIDSSFVKKGDIFNYIAVLGNNPPDRFKIWNLIYFNDKTNVKLYSIGGVKWVY